MVDTAELEAVMRIVSEHTVRWYHSSRGADGQWIDYASCAVCKRLDGEAQPELHPARMLADAGLLTVPARGPERSRLGSSLL